MTSVLENILARTKEVGVSPRAASLRAGLGATFIRDLVRNPSRSPSVENLRKLALGLETTFDRLVAGTNYNTAAEPSAPEVFSPAPEVTGSARQVTPKLVPAAYGGLVEAGAFRPVDDLNEFPDIEPQIVEQDDLFPFARMVTFDVAGDSMNALKPRPIMPGDRLVCVDYEASISRLPFKAGMVVVVERIANGGHLRERSVKQIEIHDDRVEFHPRSTNRKHQPIVIDKDAKADDGEVVRVIAIVREIKNKVPLG